MLDRNHNYKVEKKLKDCLKSDRARVQVGRIVIFGLLELSRQRLKVNEDSKFQLDVGIVMDMEKFLLHIF